MIAVNLNPFYIMNSLRALLLQENIVATTEPFYLPVSANHISPFSQGCLWDGALERYLKNHPRIKRLVFAVDDDYLSRDKDGVLTSWEQRTADKWCKKYSVRGYECAVHGSHLKDFNKDLLEMRKGRTPDNLDRQRESELQAEFEKDAAEDPAEEQER